MRWVARTPWWRVLSIMLCFEFYPEEIGEPRKGCKPENYYTVSGVAAIMKADEAKDIKKFQRYLRLRIIKTISEKVQVLYLGSPLMAHLMWQWLVNLCCEATISVMVFSSFHVVCTTRESCHNGVFKTEKEKQCLFVHKEVNQVKNRKLCNEVLKPLGKCSFAK